MTRIAVLGGGPSGLSAAWQAAVHLKDCRIDLYEASDRIGGVCGYYGFDGLKLDLGPHKIYSILPGIMEVFKELGGSRLEEMEKRHKIIVRGRLLDYPVRLGQMFPLFSVAEVFSLGLSVAGTIIKSPFVRRPLTYEDYCVAMFGGKVYDVVFRSLAEKIWGDPKVLSADIARTRIPTRNASELILRMLGIIKESERTNAEVMLYPSGGFFHVCEWMADRIRGLGQAIHLNTRPVEFIRDDGRIKSIIFNDKSRKDVDLVISSIPLKELGSLLFPGGGKRGEEDLIRMRHSVIVYLLLNRPRALDDHWIFCADKNILFSRIAEQKLFSGEGLPKDKTVISCDFTCDDDSPLWKEKEEYLAGRCVGDLEKLRLINAPDVSAYRVARIRDFYPIYETGYKEKLGRFFRRINGIGNIVCAGRLGLASYNNIDHCLDMGIYLAESLAQGKGAPSINEDLLRRAGSYRIVD